MIAYVNILFINFANYTSEFNCVRSDKIYYLLASHKNNGRASKTEKCTAHLI